MRVLVTGAAGFVGRWLCRALLAAGHEVVGAVYPSRADPAAPPGEPDRPMRLVPLALEDPASVRAVVRGERAEAVVHLAAVASGAEARRDPAHAWLVNAVGTARLAEELGRLRLEGVGDPLLILASTGEVYGPSSRRPSVETDPVEPCSPYAASKEGAELAARETAARTGLRVTTVRPFTQFGPGQDERFLVPALTRRLLAARQARAPAIKVGNLDPVRDFIDVRDAAAAIVALLGKGVPGETYNIATGCGIGLRELFDRLASAVGIRAIPETDAALVRPADLPYLVGDASKLRAACGWEPAIPMEKTLSDLVATAADVAAVR